MTIPFLPRFKAQIAMSLSIRPTSRAAGKEGREPDRNVLMYLRTGSAGPTQPAARIVGRRLLGGKGGGSLVVVPAAAFATPTTGWREILGWDRGRLAGAFRRRGRCRRQVTFRRGRTIVPCVRWRGRCGFSARSLALSNGGGNRLGVECEIWVGRGKSSLG